MASIHRQVAGFQRDEVYVGTAEERAATEHGDKPATTSEVGHLAGGAFPANNNLPLEHWVAGTTYTDRRARILDSITSLRAQIKDASTDEEIAELEKKIQGEVAALKVVNRQEGQSFRRSTMDRDMDLGDLGELADDEITEVGDEEEIEG